MTSINRARQRGFTLIEVCIVMVLGGIVMASLSSLMNVYLKGKAERETRENLAKVETALKAYLEFNNYYPCPASRDAKRADQNFGKAAETCIQKKDELITSLSPNTGTVSVAGREDNKIQIGLLPFRSLGITDVTARDGWGRLFQYAVTESLTSPDLFDQKLGSIEVIDENGNSRVTPPGTVQYVVISTGEDGVAGYTGDGVKKDVCPQDLTEKENCNDDSVFMDAPRSYKTTGKKSKKRSKADFDDTLAYKQYDPDIITGSGLLFYYYDTCYKGFQEIDVSKHDVYGIDTLSKTASFNNSDSMSGEQKLCYTRRFSTSITLLSKEGGEPAGCPIGWIEIGYKLSQDKSQDLSQRFRRRGNDVQHINNIVCAR